MSKFESGNYNVEIGLQWTLWLGIQYKRQDKKESHIYSKCGFILLVKNYSKWCIVVAFNVQSL